MPPACTMLAGSHAGRLGESTVTKLPREDCPDHRQLAVSRCHRVRRCRGRGHCLRHLNDDAKAMKPPARSAAWADAPCTARSTSPVAAGRFSLSAEAARARADRHPVQQRRRHQHSQAFEAYTEEEFDRIGRRALKGMFFMAQAIPGDGGARAELINVASGRVSKGAEWRSTRPPRRRS